MLKERIDASPEYGFSCNLNILLGKAHTGSEAFAGGDDEGDGCHGPTIGRETGRFNKIDSLRMILLQCGRDRTIVPKY